MYAIHIIWGYYIALGCEVIYADKGDVIWMYYSCARGFMIILMFAMANECWGCADWKLTHTRQILISFVLELLFVVYVVLLIIRYIHIILPIWGIVISLLSGG